MKKQVILILLLMFGLSLSSIAQGRGGKNSPRQQEPRTPEQRATQLTDRLDKQLNLSAAQKEQIYGFNLEAAQKVDNLRVEGKENREAGNVDRQAHLEQRKAIEKERDDKIGNVLNAQQKAKYQTMKQNARSRIKERKGKGKFKGKGKGKLENESLEEPDED